MADIAFTSLISRNILNRVHNYGHGIAVALGIIGVLCGEFVVKQKVNNKTSFTVEFNADSL